MFPGLMFRLTLLYFRKTMRNRTAGSDFGGCAERASHKELVFALESARTRLAIAIAAESRCTPLESRRYYLDTEDRMRRCLKELRASEGTGAPDASRCNRALAMLQALPGLVNRKTSIEGAQQLCRLLTDVLTGLEERGG